MLQDAPFSEPLAPQCTPERVVTKGSKSVKQPRAFLQCVLIFSIGHRLKHRFSCSILLYGITLSAYTSILVSPERVVTIAECLGRVPIYFAACPMGRALKVDVSSIYGRQRRGDQSAFGGHVLQDRGGQDEDVSTIGCEFLPPSRGRSQLMARIPSHRVL